MDALLDAVLFFELNDAEVVNMDAAVNVLESIASRLQSLAPREKTFFLGHAHKRARETNNSEEKELLLDLANLLGLTSD